MYFPPDEQPTYDDVNQGEQGSELSYPFTLTRTSLPPSLPPAITDYQEEPEQALYDDVHDVPATEEPSYQEATEPAGGEEGGEVSLPPHNAVLTLFCAPFLVGTHCSHHI